MRKNSVFYYRCQSAKVNNGKYLLYDDVRAEIFAGHNETTKEEYAIRVEEACSFWREGEKLAR